MQSEYAIEVLNLTKKYKDLGVVGHIIFTVSANAEPILFGLTVPKNFQNQDFAVSWEDFLAVLV